MGPLLAYRNLRPVCKQGERGTVAEDLFIENKVQQIVVENVKLLHSKNDNWSCCYWVMAVMHAVALGRTEKEDLGRIRIEPDEYRKLIFTAMTDRNPFAVEAKYTSLVKFD